METRVRPDSGTAVLFTADSLLFKEKTKQNKTQKADGRLSGVHISLTSRSAAAGIM